MTAQSGNAHTVRTAPAIFDCWRDLRTGLEELGGFVEQWLAGSYVSDKQQPNDLDVVTLFGGPTFDAMPRHRRLMSARWWQAT